MRNLEKLQIGNNPIIKIGEQIGFPQSDVNAVLEYMNPGGSHKDRPVSKMIGEGIRTNEINDNTTVVDYTTGSAGISIARICRAIGLKATLVMPSDITQEREELIKKAGAKLVLTDKTGWVKESVDTALEICRSNPNHYLLNQSANPGNKDSFHDLAYGILAHFQDGKPIDYFVLASGTSATVVGVAEVFKRYSPRTRIIAVDVSKSPSTWALKHGQKFTHYPHKLYGTGAGAASPIATAGIGLIDEVYRVDDDEAYETCRELTKNGIEIGPTSGANVMVTREILRQNPNARIVTVFFDQADRYRSIGL